MQIPSLSGDLFRSSTPMIRKIFMITTLKFILLQFHLLKHMVSTSRQPLKHKNQPVEKETEIW